MVFSYANGIWVLREVLGIGLCNAAFQFEEAGFLLGDELILCRELVTKGLNEVVFGFELTGMGFEKGGIFGLQQLDGFHLCGKGGVHDAGRVDVSRCRYGGSRLCFFAVCREFFAGAMKEPVKAEYLASGPMESDNKIFIILFFASGKATGERHACHFHFCGDVLLHHVPIELQPINSLF